VLNLTEAAGPQEGAIPLVNVPLWAWAAFIVFVLAMLALDLFVLHRGAREVSLREAALWSAIWVVLALGFGGLLFAWQGGGTAEAYLAGYLIEKSLSVDSIFVFALIFHVRRRSATRPGLMFGVIGALSCTHSLPAATIGVFHATIYLFGAAHLHGGPGAPGTAVPRSIRTRTRCCA
jgi:tellurite resistance protein TerC